MRIAQIHLRDWKAYPIANFDFSDCGTRENNVALVGALNGYGKTSLLEAVILGLYGKDGLRLVARADTEGDQAKQELSYNGFLRRAFHKPALEQGRNSMFVGLTFDDAEGGPLRIERVWHFSSSGMHRQDQEEVRIWLGADEELLPIPALDDRDDFLRGFIAQNLLPVDLAQFFLFDGEQVQKLARRDMATQVKLGIEGILGVPVVRELSDDLRGYARTCRKEIGSVGDAKIDQLREEVEALETQEDGLREQLDKIGPELEPLVAERDRLQGQITSLPGGNVAEMGELYETKERLLRDQDRRRDQLGQLLTVDIAIGLSGRKLQSRVHTQLNAESITNRWASGKEQGEARIDQFIDSLSSAFKNVQPPLSAEQQTQIDSHIREVWDQLWYPPPEGFTEDIKHKYLVESDRGQVVDKLEEVGTIATGSVQQLLKEIKYLDEEIRRHQSLIAERSGVDEQMKTLTNSLTNVVARIEQLNGRQKELTRELEGLRGMLNPKRQDLGLAQERYHSAKPLVRRSDLADKVATVIERVIGEAFPTHIDMLATEMTEAFKSMAHKQLVDRIEIDTDCSVKLLGDQGRDIREMDISAGENQIFALSLIASIARISSRVFPVIMDTPLARLDSEHRENVLNYFTSSGGQIILLSHQEEVSGKYLDLVRPRVAKTYHVRHREIGNGVGVSQLEDGYFGESWSWR